MKKIAILGCGNLGLSIVDGLLKSKFCSAANIIMTRRNLTYLSSYQQQGIYITTDNALAAKDADIVILAVKPFQAIEVMKQISNELTPNKILVSAVTGVSIEELQSVLPPKAKLFRAMPNTAIAIQQSMTCISYSGSDINDLEWVRQLFSVLGKVAIIDEKLMDAATVLGACGTAFALRYIRANIQGGIEIGFSAETAKLIAAQTVKGAAALLLENGLHPEQEIDRVTTPRGCTIAGLNEMEHQGFSSSLIKGLIASYKKINE
ncbi:MAG: pyrroline-5-carboxylate reductase [Flavipsychrobacter sp.]|nr:pyrroline-5-carboxylate reductase [Flavipsychrobacter sp.]